MKIPILSIITINRNNAEGLRKTIQSVAEQTCRNFEHIIIDGASTDESVKIIKEYANSEAGKNLSYWISEPDTGVYNAMNKAIPHATGEYCLFLNSGDWLVDNTKVQKIEDSHYAEDIIYFDALCVFKDKIILKKYPQKLTCSYFLNRGTINHQNEIIKTSLLKENLYNEEYKIISDTEFNTKMICINKCTTKHETDSISYYESEDGISSDKNNRRILKEEQIKVLVKLFDESLINDYNLLYDYQYGYCGLLRLFRSILFPLREFILFLVGKLRNAKN